MRGDRPHRYPWLVPGVILLGALAISTTMGLGAEEPRRGEERPWRALITQAEQLGLPSRFLQAVAPRFVTIQFADLRSFAAEYHLDEHRMVLNRPLSFNAAGGVLRSLAKLPHRDLGTLYHELFHAYMDYVSTVPAATLEDPRETRVLEFARTQQACRYRRVVITPIPQRKSLTEVRYLSPEEAWEALNETWAMFIGWAIWTKLDLLGHEQPLAAWDEGTRAQWLQRLEEADRRGDLIGYYEPADPEERQMVQKRYLAPTDGISPTAVRLLMEAILEEAPSFADDASRVIEPNRSPDAQEDVC